MVGLTVFCRYHYFAGNRGTASQVSPIASLSPTNSQFVTQVDVYSRSSVPEDRGSNASLRQRWIASFSSDSTESHRKIAEEIWLGGPRHIPWLAEMLLHEIEKSPDRAELTAGVLAKIGTPEAIAVILEAYRSEVADPNVRKNLTLVFDLIQNPAAVSFLFETAVEGKDLELYSAIIRAVARLSDETFVRTMTAALFPPSSERAQFVAESALRAVPAERLSTVAAEYIVPGLPPRLLHLFCTALGNDGSESSIHVLAAALEKVLPSERQIILDGLFRVNKAESANRLAELALRSADQEVRKTAVYALANLPSKVALATLERIRADARGADLKEQVDFVARLATKLSERASNSPNW